MDGVTRRVLASAVLLLAACSSSHLVPATPASSPSSSMHSARRAVPQFAHIVVVVEENRSYAEVIGNPGAPFINELARRGVLLADSFGVAHPSEPNYLALFAGSTHGLTDDSCPHTYGGANLAAELHAHGKSFAGYAEGLPHSGYLGCTAGEYARKHAPWTDFAGLPASTGRPLSAFPSDYAALPTVSFVVPDLADDMHDGTVADGDRWLRAHLGGYASWAPLHDSLLIITWDEDDLSAGNHIPGLLVGAHVRRGTLRSRLDHYTVLRTIEASCGLPALGIAGRRAPIRGIWS
jgi:acid phosphatase